MFPFILLRGGLTGNEPRECWLQDVQGKLVVPLDQDQVTMARSDCTKGEDGHGKRKIVQLLVMFRNPSIQARKSRHTVELHQTM